MERQWLDQCLYTAGYWIHKNSSVIDDFTDPNKKVILELSTRFKLELEHNLAENESIENVYFIATYYLYKIREIQFLLEKHSLLIEKTKCQTSKFKLMLDPIPSFEEFDLTQIEIYILLCYKLFNNLLHSIHDAFFYTKINLLELLQKFDYKPDLYDLAYLNSSFKPKKVDGRLRKQHDPFREYLVIADELKDELAEICLKVFNQYKSPKVYAIMVCILSEKNFILLLDENRALFYRAWYDFIGEKYPKGNRFDSINKHFIPKDDFFIISFKTIDNIAYEDFLTVFNAMSKNLMEKINK